MLRIGADSFRRRGSRPSLPPPPRRRPSRWRCSRALAAGARRRRLGLGGGLPELQSPARRPHRRGQPAGRQLRSDARHGPQLPGGLAALRPLPPGLGRQPAETVARGRRRQRQGLVHPRRPPGFSVSRTSGGGGGNSELGSALPRQLHRQRRLRRRPALLRQGPVPALHPGPLGHHLPPRLGPLHQIPRRAGRHAAGAVAGEDADGDLLQAGAPAALGLPGRAG